MNVVRKLMLGAGAVVLPLTAVTFIGTVPASAARSTGTTQGGTITCSKVKGVVTFKPPLTASGTAPETTTVKMTLSKCKSAAGATVIPKSGKVDTVISGASSTDSCGSLLGSGTPTPETLTIKWKPASINPSTSSYSGYDITTNSNNDEGFTLPNSGGTGATTGSYAESSGSTATAYSNETATTLGSECSSTKGLKSLKITNGSTTL